jgi:thioredoxin 1
VEIEKQQAEMKDNQVQEIDEAEFNAQVLGSKKPALVGFVAGWSPACGRIEPVLEEVAKVCNGTVKVFKVDVDDNPDLGTEFGIQSVPVLIFFCDGDVRVRITGTVSAKAIFAKLNSLTPGSAPALQKERGQSE